MLSKQSTLVLLILALLLIVSTGSVWLFHARQLETHLIQKDDHYVLKIDGKSVTTVPVSSVTTQGQLRPVTPGIVPDQQTATEKTFKLSGFVTSATIQTLESGRENPRFFDVVELNLILPTSANQSLQVKALNVATLGVFASPDSLTFRNVNAWELPAQLPPGQQVIVTIYDASPQAAIDKMTEINGQCDPACQMIGHLFERYPNASQHLFDLYTRQSTPQGEVPTVVFFDLITPSMQLPSLAD